MIKKILLFLIIISTTFSIFPKNNKIKFYGLYETIFDSAQKREYDSDIENNENVNPYGYFSWGWSNYANLRMKAEIGDYIKFGLALDIEMLAGNYTELYKYYGEYAKQIVLNPNNANFASQNFFSLPFYYKNTYIGSFGLERLYFSGGNDYFNIETGLVRIARGYGYSFSPLDLFNPKDPLNPSKRPEGKLSFISTFYPMEMWKIESFIIAPDNPVDSKGWGFKFGAATQFNIDRFNFEFLYTLFLPEIEYEKDPADLGLPEYTNNDFTQIVGFSFKADIEIGLFIDLIYKFEHKSFKELSYYGEEFYGFKGLEAAIGIDYTISIPNTTCSFYLLLEYQFYGSGMIDWWENDINEIYTDNNWYKNDPISRKSLINTDKKPLYYLRHDYIFGMIKFTINTYATLGVSYLFGIDDQSGLFNWFVDIEPFQAFTINISASYPISWEIINPEWNKGEFGSSNVGYYQDYKISAKLKF